MEKVFQGQVDVTHIHNPNKNRWIEFKADYTFVSDGDPFGRNTGKWSINELTKVLFIHSDIENDDSEWNLVIEGDKIIWTGIGNEWKENFKLIHIRES